MAPSAALNQEDPRVALLEAKLKAWFSALAAQPIPADLLRHVDRLERGPVNGFKREPETR